jgi:hypothetical protein
MSARFCHAGRCGLSQMHFRCWHLSDLGRYALQSGLGGSDWPLEAGLLRKASTLSCDLAHILRA